MIRSSDRHGQIKIFVITLFEVELIVDQVRMDINHKV